MAKTKKKEEVIDFTKPEKITEDQLKKLRSVVTDINQVQHQIGVLEAKKHSMIHGMAEHQSVLMQLREEFEKDYGTIDIDINDGTIKYEKENGEINKED
tara:strand:- start:38 stop:334 length:297 start_codon:yes stop_codon:yes gene_type:complete